MLPEYFSQQQKAIFAMQPHYVLKENWVHRKGSKMDISTLQPILSTRQGENDFSLYGDGPSIAESRYLHLFLGLSLVDRVPNDPCHFLYKLVMARLRLVGFKYNDILAICKCSENTRRHWARVLKSGDAKLIAQVFGLTSRGKLTPDSLVLSFFWERSMSSRARCSPPARWIF